MMSVCCCARAAAARKTVAASTAINRQGGGIFTEGTLRAGWRKSYPLRQSLPTQPFSPHPCLPSTVDTINRRGYSFMTMQELDLLQGTLDFLVLRALAWGPSHGYGIARFI